MDLADVRKAIYEYRNWAKTNRQRIKGVFKDEAKERIERAGRLAIAG